MKLREVADLEVRLSALEAQVSGVGQESASDGVIH
jgi:hypothetical protein